MSDSDGPSLIASTEPITASTLVSESGGEPKEKGRPSRKVSGEVNCRSVAFLYGDGIPKLYLISELGSFFIKLSDLQVGLILEDASAYVRKAIEKKK